MLLSTFFLIVYGSFCFGLAAHLSQARRIKDAVFPRPTCASCHEPISLLILVPILGYFCAHGHCTRCKNSLSKTPLFFEALGGLLGLALSFGSWTLAHNLPTLTALALLLLLSLDDWRSLHIYDSDLLLLVLVLFGDLLLTQTQAWFLHIIGMGTVALPLLLLRKVGKNSLGSGDVLLMAVMGFYLGPLDISYAFLLACLAALVYSLWLMAFRKATPTTSIPLIPFLALGCSAMLLGLCQ